MSGSAPPGLDGDESNRFFARLERASTAFLLLDYDGTLAPFRKNPAEARPYPEVIPLLRAIQDEGTTRIVIVSGRSLESILPLLEFGGSMEVWGSHGREQRLPSGEIRYVKPSAIQLNGLEEARKVIEGMDAPGRVEQKPFSVAFHVRGVPEEAAQASLEEARRLWAPIAQKADLDVTPFDGGVEIRAPGWNKGDVVNAVLEGVTEDLSAAYLGDDDTDEDAFRALKGRGLTVLVREQPRDTEAQVWLRPPGEMVVFLERWQEIRLRAQ